MGKQKSKAGAVAAVADEEDQEKKFIDAYRTLIRAVQDAWSSEGAQRRAEEALKDFASATRATWIPKEVQDRLDEAQSVYLRAVKESWAQIDPEKLDPRTVASIGQSLMAAAGWMANTSRMSVGPRWPWMNLRTFPWWLF